MSKKSDRRREYEARISETVITNIKQALGADFSPLPDTKREFAKLNRIKDGQEQAKVWQLECQQCAQASPKKASPKVDERGTSEPIIKHFDHRTPAQLETTEQKAKTEPNASGFPGNADFTFAEDRKLARYRHLPPDARAMMLAKELRNINSWGALGADSSAPVIESYDPKCLLARIMVSRDADLLQATSSLLIELCRERVHRMATEPEFAKLLIAVQRFAGTLHVEGQIVLGKDHSRVPASEYASGFKSSGVSGGYSHQ